MITQEDIAKAQPHNAVQITQENIAKAHQDYLCPNYYEGGTQLDTPLILYSTNKREPTLYS